MSKNRLGRGLEALLGDLDEADPADEEQPQILRTEGLTRLPIEWLQVTNTQPRLQFDQEALGELAESIRIHGILQPIIVMPSVIESGKYFIVAGERRWRAAQTAGLSEVPVIIRDRPSENSLEIALIENIQRVDLNPLEEAQAFAQLIDDYGMTQQQVAQQMGKSRPYVANRLRLLQLPEKVRLALEKGQLSEGHLRLLIGQDRAEQFAQSAIDENWSVKELQQALRDNGKATGERPAHPKRQSEDLESLARKLSEKLQMNVTIKAQKQGRGRLSIAFDNLEQFDELERLLMA